MADTEQLDMGLVVSNYKILSQLVQQDLDKEYKAQRIKGTEYADVYNKLMGEVLRLAMNSPSQDADIKGRDAATLDTIAKTKIAIDQSQADLQLKAKDVELKTEQIALTRCETDLCEEKVKLTQYQAEDQKYVTDYIRPSERTKMQYESEYTEWRSKDQEYVTTYIRPEERCKLEKECNLTEARDLDQRYITQYVRPEELELKRKEVEIAMQELALKEKQAAFTERQTEGFDDNLKTKMLEIQMNTWAMMFSSGMLSCPPSIIENDEVYDLYCNMKTGLGLDPCDPKEPCEEPPRNQGNGNQ